MKRTSGRKLKAPAFQVYPADYLTDDAYLAMSFEQRGVFWHLLGLSWLNEGLSTDLAVLARACGLSPRDFGRLWPAVSACFEERNGRLVNPRQEREREAQAENRQRRLDAGAKGNAAQGKGRNACADGDANGDALRDALRTPSSLVSRLSSSVPTERAEAPPAGPPAALVPAKPPRAEPTGPDAEFRTWWCAAFHAKTGNAYGWDFGKDSKLLSGILKRVGLDEAKSRASRLLHAPPEWVVRDGSGVDIGTLNRLLNQLGSAGKLTPTNSVRELAIDAASPPASQAPLFLPPPRKRA